MYSQQNFGGHNASSLVELSLSARRLNDRDITSKSDPQCVVFMKNGFDGKFIEIGRTEVIRNNLNPDWVKKLEVNYRFNESQQIKFEIWDIDPISGNEFLGQCVAELGAIVASKGGTYQQKLTADINGRGRGGELIIRGEEVSANKQTALIHFEAQNLDKKDFLGKSDPYLVISKANNDGTFSVVHKTEVIKNNINPSWRPFNISLQQLCGGDFDRTLKIDCYDFDEGTNHDIIGSFTTNLRKLSSGPSQQNTYECMNTEKQKRKKGYKNSGIIRLLSTKITEEVSFLDYIRGGTQMHFAVAIDFTASNGDPRDQRSLHFLDYSGRPNSYEIALRAVGEVIKSYDTQGMFPAYGFGAKIPPHGQVSHIFPLNNNPSHPYCRGIDEIVNCYKTTLNSVTLSGPTNFAPTVNSTANIARGLQDGKHYFVLLIITDGVISDMAETMDAIVNASSLPISLIIIGVGNADFSAMQFLDADKGAIVSRGRRAVRDIVQFVPLSKYVYNNWEQNQYELGREVLAEIPTQFKQFMQSRGFRPSVGGAAAQTKGGFPEPTTESVYPSVPTDATFQPSAAASHGPYQPSNTAHNYPPPVASNVYPPTNQMYAPSALITSSTTQPTYASSQPSNPTIQPFYPAANAPYGQFSYPNSGAPANPPPNASMNVYPQPSTMPPNPHSTYPPSYPPQY